MFIKEITFIKCIIIIIIIISNDDSIFNIYKKEEVIIPSNSIEESKYGFNIIESNTNSNNNNILNNSNKIKNKTNSNNNKLTNNILNNNNIVVPKHFNLISDIILNKPFDQNGLFSVNSTKQRLRTANSLLQDIVEHKVSEEKGKELFDRNFDLIDSCEVYKTLLRSFNCCIIPNGYINIIIKINSIHDNIINNNNNNDNITDDKLILTKAMYYSLPFNNRNILESNVMLCYKICLKTSQMENKEKQMDLDGISIVMMPNLFLKKDKDIEIEKVLELVSFCKYFYKAFPEVCGIEEKYL